MAFYLADYEAKYGQLIIEGEKCIVIIYKSKRADTYCEEIKDIKDPMKLIGFLKDVAKRYGIALIDESHLPGRTGENRCPA